MATFDFLMSSPAAMQPPVHAFGQVFVRLQPHLASLDIFLRDQVARFEPEIRSMADYCIDTSGKRIRPALVFLSGWRGDEAPSPDLVKAAAVVELVHLATLVHDDIMDEAELRRKRRTAAREFGATAAVLLGDALFSHALHLAAQFPTTEVCLHVAESTRRVCAGEIVQTLRRGSTDISREDYWRIIDLKTAELFRVSCFLGSRLAGSPAAYVEAVTSFGRHLGIAYQVYDDLADFFGDEQRIGKTLGTDLSSGKITLPLQILLDRLPPAERAGLNEEIAGRRSPQMLLRFSQMKELGVFPSVADAINAEIATATEALSAWPTEGPTPLLLELGSILREQVAALNPEPPKPAQAG
ncbi:MAG TPA: polyprenyl synthetase family protein [Opitutaceae bacterium]|nr:polyprenyl synthetase family protein [Opitutaceae bacterium]HRJ46030.1 polyprenyl synthetase family protein [Opitutaceae bacterium]